MKIVKNRHHTYRIMYHFVWIPKYRNKVFKGFYREFLIGIIKKIAYDYDMSLEEIEVLDDHIHALTTSEPKMSPSRIMQIIKSISAREFFKRFPEIKSKYFWGGKLWTRSYFVETVGERNESEVREYVRNQLKEIDEIEPSFRQLGLFD
jgi:putative transposase